MNFVVIALVWLNSAGIVLAQDAVQAIAEPASYLPDWVTKWIPVMIALLLVMRALSELFLKLANALSNDGNSGLHKAANLVASIAEYMAKALAMVGIGMPSQLVLQRAEKINAKGVVDGSVPPATGP